MAWDPGVGWSIAAGVVVGGLTLLAVFRPWRFLQARVLCPQCRQTLPRWNFWGWKDSWTCRRCGCQVGP